eukprot:TRINITY_DN5128_c3_g2_i2.p1 TRINITY_DN5128_c3_g2~~TRINITY_DN5128_c3_g2_i2.p1  ORF type:complete len:571 (-),score=177.27 TRINITY_DN5128_c3_g2_i2:107-1819(-)
MSSKRNSSELHRVGPYILGGLLGEGASSQVFSGFHVDTAVQVAIKMVHKEALEESPAMRGKLEREIAVMKLLDHPHVLQLYDVLETDTHLFLILEHAPNGELFDYLMQKGALDMRDARSVFRQIASGIAYCHHHQICHRDLKPENLLLDSNSTIKLADFGMAALRKEGELLKTSCGSPHYASPEVVCGKSYDGLQSDVWSCGVILFALASGKLPFDDENIRKLLGKVKIGEFSMPPYFPADLQHLIRRMLTVDPAERATIHEVISHEWFVSDTTPEDPLAIELCPSSHAIEPDAVIDPDVMRSMQALGFGPEPADVFMKLANPSTNLAKAVYWMLEDRRANPKQLPAPCENKLARVQSDPKIDDRGDSKRRKQTKLGRRGSAYGAPFRSFLLGKDRKKEASATSSTSSTALASPRGFSDDDEVGHDAERKSWFMSIVNRSTERFTQGAHKRDIQRYYSDQPHERIERRLKKFFSDNNMEWSSTSNNKFKGKAVMAGWDRPVRFEVQTASASDAMGLTVHCISLGLRQGSRGPFQALVEQFEEAIRGMLIEADTQTQTLFAKKLSRRPSKG